MLGAISLVLTAAQVRACRAASQRWSRRACRGALAQSHQRYEPRVVQSSCATGTEEAAGRKAAPRPRACCDAGAAAALVRGRQRLLRRLLAQAPAAGGAGRRPELLRGGPGALLERCHDVRHAHPAVPGGGHPHHLHDHHHDRLPLEGAAARRQGRALPAGRPPTGQSSDQPSARPPRPPLVPLCRAGQALGYLGGGGLLQAHAAQDQQQVGRRRACRVPHPGALHRCSPPPLPICPCTLRPRWRQQAPHPPSPDPPPHTPCRIYRRLGRNLLQHASRAVAGQFSESVTKEVGGGCSCCCCCCWGRWRPRPRPAPSTHWARSHCFP
jgi:hypothetical protein